MQIMIVKLDFIIIIATCNGKITVQNYITFKLWNCYIVLTKFPENYVSDQLQKFQNFNNNENYIRLFLDET